MSTISVKIRLRKGEKPLRTFVDSSSTVKAANNSIRNDLKLPEGAFLSLNGKDPLGDDAQTLLSTGVTNGDILRVVGLPPPPPEAATTPVAPPDTKISALEPAPVGSVQKAVSTFHLAAPIIADPASVLANTLGIEKRKAFELLSMSGGDLNSAAALCLDSGLSGSSAMEIDSKEEVKQSSTGSAMRHTFDGIIAEAKLKNAKDVAVLLAHICLTDLGFVPVGGKLSSTWNSMPGGMYVFSYTHESNPVYECTVRFIVVGDKLNVIGGLAEMPTQVEVGDPIQCQISTDKRVHWPGEAFEALCPGHVHLVAEIISSVGRPLLFRLTNSSCRLLLLPTSLQSSLMSTLRAGLILKLGASSRALRRAANDNKLWASLFREKFGPAAASARGASSELNWKAFYVNEVETDRERKKKREEIRDLHRQEEEFRRRVEDQRSPFGDFDNDPDGPGIYPPGVIGGDYDRDPFGGQGGLMVGPRRGGRGGIGPGFLPDSDLPVGSVPPGARFDPFNPLGGGPLGGPRGGKGGNRRRDQFGTGGMPGGGGFGGFPGGGFM